MCNTWLSVVRLRFENTAAFESQASIKKIFKVITSISSTLCLLLHSLFVPTLLALKKQIIIIITWTTFTNLFEFGRIKTICFICKYLNFNKSLYSKYYFNNQSNLFIFALFNINNAVFLHLFFHSIHKPIIKLWLRGKCKQSHPRWLPM